MHTWYISMMAMVHIYLVEIYGEGNFLIASSSMYLVFDSN